MGAKFIIIISVPLAIILPDFIAVLSVLINSKAASVSCYIILAKFQFFTLKAENIILNISTLVQNHFRIQINNL